MELLENVDGTLAVIEEPLSAVGTEFEIASLRLTVLSTEVVLVGTVQLRAAE